MVHAPMDVLKLHPIRKSNSQKEAFREDVLEYLEKQGYVCTLERFHMKGQNIVIGDPETAKYLITAHYDTPASIGIPNVCTPCNALRTYGKFFFYVLLGAFVGAGAGTLMRDGFLIPGPLLLLIFVAFMALSLSGPANVNNANDNTSGVVTLLEIARTLPVAHRNGVCFVLFDLEERGLVGSAAYRKRHKTATENQIVLNLDCVGDGDHILFMPAKKARSNLSLIRELKRLGGWFGQKQILVIDKGFCSYNSDQKHFPMGVAIAAFHQRKGKDFVLDKIHTKHDINLDVTNVNILRAALSTLISGNAVN